jgi:hypothetical protein
MRWTRGSDSTAVFSSVESNGIHCWMPCAGQLACEHRVCVRTASFSLHPHTLSAARLHNPRSFRMHHVLHVEKVRPLLLRMTRTSGHIRSPWHHTLGIIWLARPSIIEVSSRATPFGGRRVLRSPSHSPIRPSERTHQQEDTPLRPQQAKPEQWTEHPRESLTPTRFTRRLGRRTAGDSRTSRREQPCCARARSASRPSSSRAPRAS